MHFVNRAGIYTERYPPVMLLNAKYKRTPRELKGFLITPTYSEPPVPLKKGTSAHVGLKYLYGMCDAVGCIVTTLDTLKYVFCEISSREGVRPAVGRYDRCFQRTATLPTGEDVKEYSKNIALFQNREKGRPSSARAVREAFYEHPDLLKQLETLTFKKCSERTEYLHTLFKKAELTMGALGPFEHIAADDIVRYSRELRHYKIVVQRKYDIDNNLPLRNPR